MTGQPPDPTTPAPWGASLVLAVTLLVPFVLAGCMDHTHELGDPVATNEVRIGGPWVFDPDWISILHNTTVNWTNHGDAYHTVTIRSLGFHAVIKPGDTARYTFTQPGTYDYVCEYHQPNMLGRITVTSLPGPSVANGTTTNTTAA